MSQKEEARCDSARVLTTKSLSHLANAWYQGKGGQEKGKKKSKRRGEMYCVAVMQEGLMFDAENLGG
jgi:hypothetical protein